MKEKEKKKKHNNNKKLFLHYLTGQIYTLYRLCIPCTNYHKAILILVQQASFWDKKLSKDTCKFCPAITMRKPYLLLRAGKVWRDGNLQELLP